MLVVVTSDNIEVRDNLRRVLSEEDIVVRFHIDVVAEQSDDAWKDNIRGMRDEPGIVIIRPGQFGLKGNVMRQLTDTAHINEIRSSLLESNTTFSSLEKRKFYDDHVAAGLRQGIYFANEIPYREEYDADGVIDRQQRRRN